MKAYCLLNSPILCGTCEQGCYTDWLATTEKTGRIFYCGNKGCSQSGIRFTIRPVEVDVEEVTAQ